MRALVMDFDGVISDSARESFAVALRTYRDLEPKTKLREEEPLYRPFLELMPLGNRAEDYGTILAALDAGSNLPDQPAYDAFRASLDPDWLRRYHARFYEVRTAMARADPEAWLGLMRPYGPFVEILRRRAGSAAYAVATAKDRASVELLLLHYGLADLIPADLVADKEVGARKSAHLRHLHDRLGIGWPEMTFLDDKVNHLDAVAPLGVRCALAAWGYNGVREHRLAERRGYLVCSLQDGERRLFGG